MRPYYSLHKKQLEHCNTGIETKANPSRSKIQPNSKSNMAQSSSFARALPLNDVWRTNVTHWNSTSSICHSTITNNSSHSTNSFREPRKNKRSNKGKSRRNAMSLNNDELTGIKLSNKSTRSSSRNKKENKFLHGVHPTNLLGLYQEVSSIRNRNHDRSPQSISQDNQTVFSFPGLQQQLKKMVSPLFERDASAKTTSATSRPRGPRGHHFRRLKSAKRDRESSLFKFLSNKKQKGRIEDDADHTIADDTIVGSTSVFSIGR